MTLQLPTLPWTKPPNYSLSAVTGVGNMDRYQGGEVDVMTAYAGFDRSDPPTADQRAFLKKYSTARWLGGYLPSPSHPARTWCGLWRVLREEGWGLAPVYVGQ